MEIIVNIQLSRNPLRNESSFCLPKGTDIFTILLKEFYSNSSAHQTSFVE